MHAAPGSCGQIGVEVWESDEQSLRPVSLRHFN
jgi:hypothetical protein